MSKQGNVLKLLSEHPITEAANGMVGEPSVQELLGDPVIHAVLRRDGLGHKDLLQAIAQGRSRLAPALPTPALPTPALTTPDLPAPTLTTSDAA